MMSPHHPTYFTVDEVADNTVVVVVVVDDDNTFMYRKEGQQQQMSSSDISFDDYIYVDNAPLTYSTIAQADTEKYHRSTDIQYHQTSRC